MMIAWGNNGGIIAAQIYQPNDFPDYITGHWIVIGFLTMSFVLVILQYLGLKFEVKKDKKKGRGSSLYIKDIQGKSDEAIEHLGDTHPRYVYDFY